MTQVQAALKADKQNVWQAGLRIREAEPSAAYLVEKSQSIACARLLRDVLQYLRTGWRWLERKRNQQLSSRRLRVSETISLGEKRSVSIVQVDGAHYLIGCSTGSVQLLAVLDRHEGGTRHLAHTERAS